MIVKSEVRPIQTDKSPNLLGDASITFRSEFGDLTINKVRLMKGRDGEPFLSFPQETYEDKQGETKYKKLVYLSKDLNGLAFESVLASYAEALKNPKKKVAA